MRFKKLTALLATAAMLGTMAVVPMSAAVAQAEETDSSIITLFAPSGTEGYSEFMAYSEANGTVTANNGWVTFNQNDGYGWNEANGIKVDVTEYLKNAQSGGQFEVSLKFTSYYWGNTNVSIYFETADGVKTNLTTTTEVGTNGTEQEVTANGTYTFSDDDTIYLCMIHPSGTQSYSYFNFSGTQKGTVIEPEEPVELVTLFAPNGLEDYSRFEGNADGTTTPNNGWVTFEGASGWNSANGIKVNVTEELKNAKSGGQFEVSLQFTSYYWGDTNVSIYFETAEGVKTNLTTATEVGTNGTAQAVTASGAFSFAEDDTIYLCVTHPSGSHSYSYFTLKGEKAETPQTTTHEEGFAFSAPITLDELQKATITVTKSENGTETTSEPIDFSTVTAGEGEAILGIIITNIPEGIAITSINID
ncbi:MAG: hypothetical protein ACI4DP_02735 [Candidatus Ornithomonoglobus sp.]